MTTRAPFVLPRSTSAAVGLLLTLSIIATACATNPVTGKREMSFMSEAQEIAIGQQSDGEIRREMGVYDNPELQRYVSDIGLRLAALSHRPNLPWTFTVVDHPAINAFALPGGFIYITRGILPYLDSEAELAGVLGHEIAHVTARHASQQYTRATTGGLGLAVLGIFVPATQPFSDLASGALGVAFLKYGREDENESDRVGMDYAAKGGWDPAGVPRFLATLARVDALTERGVPNWLSTHPEPAARVSEAQPIAARLTSPASRALNKDEFLEQIAGIVVGDGPSEGIVRGNEFVHPALRFALTFPEGWEVTNTPSQVAAREPGQPHYMLLQTVDQARGASIDEIGRRSMASAGFKALDGRRSDINGLDAHVGLYQGSISGVGAVTMRAAHIAVGRQVYLLGGFAPRDGFTRIDREVEAAIESFRGLTAREADAIRPNRLDFYTVRAGDTWQSIASRGKGLVRASELAIMNNREVNEQPAAGERIKVVVEG
jgi:predicted Zn-dependent protease